MISYFIHHLILTMSLFFIKNLLKMMMSMFQFLLVFIFSIILNLCLAARALIIIKSGLMGKLLKNKLLNLLEKQIYLFYIVPFFISLLILTYFNDNIIYLEEKDVVVTAVIDNSQFVFSGETLNLICNNLGSAAVFSGGARIAAGLVAKYPMHLLPKTGIIGGVFRAAGFTLTFKVITNTFPATISSNSNPKIQTGQVTIKMEGLSINNSTSDITANLSKLEKYFGSQKLKNLDIREINNKLEIKGTQDQSNSVIEELNKSYPNWKEDFINSPLENGDVNSIKLFLIETLTNNLILQFIIIYLMIMFIIIFTCKLIIEKDIQLNKIKEYPLGNYIYYILEKYISIWKTSANIWIYLLVFSVLIFSMGSAYSIYQVISFLK
jgi:hypothetical protein